MRKTLERLLSDGNWPFYYLFSSDLFQVTKGTPGIFFQVKTLFGQDTRLTAHLNPASVVA